jgi:hypothetical protein
MVKGNAGNEMVKFKADEIGELTSFDDAVKFLAAKGYTVETAADMLSDGFTGIEKKKLVNRSFVIVDAKISLSNDYGDDGQFAVVKVFTQDGGKFRFTDGGTGICQQIGMLMSKRADKGGAVGVVIPGGLVDSEYDYTDESTGEVTKAHTFYLNTDSE